jgi:tetratricopeptide (TPR) repeat protein
MKSSDPDPKRWMQNSPSLSVEGDLGSVFAKAASHQPLSLAAERRILQRLRAKESRPFLTFAKVTPVFFVMVLFSVVAVALVKPWVRPKLDSTKVETLAVSARTIQTHASDSVATREPVSESIQKPPISAPVTPIRVGVNPVRAKSTSIGEASMLASAFRELEVQHNPEGVLRILDELASRFPNPQLPNEAMLGRVSALTALGRRAEALNILERQPPWQRDSQRSIAAARGELRAHSENCVGANSDFGFVLQKELRDDLSQRALKGRAHCLLRLGETEAARSDLKDYLRFFPNGRFSNEIRAALGEKL